MQQLDKKAFQTCSCPWHKFLVAEIGSGPGHKFVGPRARGPVGPRARATLADASRR